MHGLGDLAAQEPEEEVADALALGEGGKAERMRWRGGTVRIHRVQPSVLSLHPSVKAEGHCQTRHHLELPIH